MVESKTFTIPSKTDGLELSGFYVKGDCVRAILYLVHGMAEHKERYVEFMEYLAQHGYLCVIMDTRGHGKSVQSDDDLGFFYDDKGSHCIEDVHHMIAMLKENSDDIPIVLFGHSMGSLIVRAYTKKYDREIDALVVCGSPSKNPMAKTALKLVNVMSKLKGEHHRSRLIHNMAFSSYGKRFEEDFSENTWLSANKENVDAYDQDKYSGFVFTLNGFKNLFHLMNIAYDEKGWSREHFGMPVLFVAGQEDPCIDSAEKFKDAYIFMQDRGYLVEHHLFEGMRHEILNETNKSIVFVYIKEWIDKQIVNYENK